MAQKAKRHILPLEPDASYETKARYYERFSTDELVTAGRLDEIGVCQHVPKTERLSLRVDKTFLAERE